MGMTPYEQILAIRKMNREQKRALAKKLHISYQELKEAIEFKIEDVTIEQLPEGTKVRLKTNQILNNGLHKNPQYREWVKKHDGDIFTCIREPSLPNDTKRCVFIEDETNPKWIFHVDDLELVLDEIKVAPTEIEKVAEDKK